MKEEQFEKLMGKLEEIKHEVGREIVNIEDSPAVNIAQVRDVLYQLESKTGWGRNEIKTLFESAIDNAT